MIDVAAGRALGELLAEAVQRLPPLLAIAISYETAQTDPAVYLAYETVDHCMARLKTSLSNSAVSAFEQRMARFVGDDEHFAVADRLGDRIGSIFNTGNWLNPADPVLLDRDPVIDAWARRAFGAILESLTDPAETVAARHQAASNHLRGTLWHAIDHARQTCPLGSWPAISFVQSFDDNSDELLLTIALRRNVR
jgi:hypothetical protein